MNDFGPNKSFGTVEFSSLSAVNFPFSSGLVLASTPGATFSSEAEIYALIARHSYRPEFLVVLTLSRCVPLYCKQLKAACTVGFTTVQVSACRHKFVWPAFACQVLMLAVELALRQSTGEGN